MLTLRLTQEAGPQPDQYIVQLRLEEAGRAPLQAAARFPFALSREDESDLRWYLEDYLQFPADPAPRIAARIEARMEAIGSDLFRAVFEHDGDTRRLWYAAHERLAETRVEVITGVRGATALPWELIRDAGGGSPLVLAARSFVRAQPQARRRPQLPRPGDGPIRILLVICRPRAGDDVPFRSVAGRLLKGLGAAERRAFDLDLLRPPTFARLKEVLHEARAAGRPYHVVHFDGHGLYAEVQEEEPGVLRKLLDGLSVLVLEGRGRGKHGFLLFEDPASEDNARLVGGPALGQLLVDTGVPVLVLNACRSAHAEAAPPPDTGSGDGPGQDVHSQVRAYGSLAQEVMDAGVAGVVAMRYNVYVVTAAEFVGGLYAALVAGRPLGQAVTQGRVHLAADPLRAIVDEARPLQDWAVPVVYEAAPVRLFPEAERPGAGLSVHLDAGGAAPAARGLDPELARLEPDVGFYGRDETILALDRAFDRHAVVLLHAYAGSGKTATAAEFARWYDLTGGLDGRVLFTSFEHLLPLARVLDAVERTFGPALEAAGVHWLALDDAARREVALQVLARVPVLWIWDNVEPVAGFPAGTGSAWSEEEQRELADFLRAARGTRAKFLLTSRREEREWLGDHLPFRVGLPPMPMQERLQLAAALAERQGRRLGDVAGWRPLLRYTGGNPLTITAVVGQALREGRATGEELAAFVRALRAGEAQIEDEEAEGRTRSLAASLGYGFRQAFDEAERRQLALLHLFQGFVNVDALCYMGNPGAEWGLAEVRGLAREEAIALLDRAAEIGLLAAHGGGYYGVHPALPWYFQSLFEAHYPGAARDRARRAFVEAVGQLADYYAGQYFGGGREVIAALGAEEANLRHARELARRHGWWRAVIMTMQGLRALYGHTGRRAEWVRLVAEIVPEFVDAATGGPRPGREEEWGLVTEYRVRLAREQRRWAEAEKLQRAHVAWARTRAAPALEAVDKGLSAAEIDRSGHNAILNLGASLHELAQVEREQGKADSVNTYEEAYALAIRFGSNPEAATAAFNLGTAYKNLPVLRDLDKAIDWYRRSLALRAAGDRLGRARCLNQIGLVTYQHFQEARRSEASEGALLRYLNDTAGYYQEALALLPPDAVDDLAVTHNQLGNVYGDAGDPSLAFWAGLDRALGHYRESIRYKELAGDVYAAGTTRYNVAVTLRAAGRYGEALAYARAALDNFSAFGDRAADMIQRTQQLTADIEGSI